jgi:hypothetical protein
MTRKRYWFAAIVMIVVLALAGLARWRLYPVVKAPFDIAFFCPDVYSPTASQTPGGPNGPDWHWASTPPEACPVIMVGTVSAIRLVGLHTKARYVHFIATVQPDTVIKGLTHTPRRVRVRFFGVGGNVMSILGVPPYGLRCGVRYLLFLRPRLGGFDLLQYDDKDRGPPPVALLPGPGVPHPQPCPPTSFDVETLVSVIAPTARGDAPLAVPAIGLLGYLAGWRDSDVARQQLVSIMNGNRPESAALAIRGLTSGPYRQRALLPELIRLSASGSSSISGAALAARIRLGGVSALTEAAAWYERTEPAPPAQVFDVSAAICGRGDSTVDEATVKGLMVLMRSRSVEFRRAAVWVLSRRREDNMAGTLMSMLDDPDPEIQRNIVDALYDVAEGPFNVRLSKEMIPTYRRCARGCSPHCIALWQKWWREGGRIEYSKGVNPSRTSLSWPGDPHARRLGGPRILNPEARQ